MKPSKRAGARVGMMESPRAKIPNTNEWRLVEKRRRRPRLGPSATPLRVLGTFLHEVGRWIDRESTLTWDEQEAAGIPTHLRVPQFYKSHTAFPGVPFDHLSAAMVYVEERMRRVERPYGAKGRATLRWLGRWSAAIFRELERREQYVGPARPRSRARARGDLPPPVLRADLMRPYEELEPVEFEQMAAPMTNTTATWLDYLTGMGPTGYGEP